MTSKAESSGSTSQPESATPVEPCLHLLGSSVENYHKALELHEYASRLTDAYNQTCIRLSQQELKVRRMQSSFSWRCTAWLRALRRKYWDPSHPPETERAEIDGLIGYPFAASDFQRPTTRSFHFEIHPGIEQIEAGKDATLAGWVKAPDCTQRLTIRARLGTRTYTAREPNKSTTVEPLFRPPNSIPFDIPVCVESDDSHLDLEIGSDAAGWHLFHRIRLHAYINPLLADNRSSMENNLAAYPKWVELYDAVTPDKLNNLYLRARKLPLQPLLSLVMPVYNPDGRWLRRAIESVQAQTYANWELCIADDASTKSQVHQILAQYAKQDSRIKVVFRTSNGHISAASNSALELATGEFTGFVDHDDEIPPQALYYFAELINKHQNAELIYSDEDKISETGVRSNPHFKPNWNPDLLSGQNYICHLAVYRTSSLRSVGGLRTGFDGAQDWDLALRITERVKPDQIHHIPRILYHWRSIEGSTALQLKAKDYIVKAARKTLEEHFTRIGQTVNLDLTKGQHWHVRHSLPVSSPLVTLILPTRNRRELLVSCVESILAKTNYPNFEILIADNESDDPSLLAFYEKQKGRGRFTVLSCPGPFNFSAINNRAAKIASGELIGFLNNDLETIHPEWLDEMVGHALRPEIGVVGAKLYYPDMRIQHAGIITGLGGVAGHAFKKFARNDPGTPQFRPHLVHNVSAVTAACAILRKSVFTQAGGFDEENLAVAFNDVDLCLRVEALGYRNLYTPFAELIHHESASRGSEYAPGKLPRFTKEIQYIKRRWGERLQNDPYYNPNLTIDLEDYSLAFPPRHDQTS